MVTCHHAFFIHYQSSMAAFVSTALGLSSLLAVLVFFLANSDIASNLSPQGCRMSWMSPSYVLQAEFDAHWSPLARRYSLWLYREVGWDAVQVSIQPPTSWTSGLHIWVGNRLQTRQPTSSVHSRERWFVSPGPLNSFLGHKAVLFIAVCYFP